MKPKSSLNKVHHEEGIMEELQKIEKENKRLEDEKNALLASLHAESVANEEQAAYIEISLIIINND